MDAMWRCRACGNEIPAWVGAPDVCPECGQNGFIDIRYPLYPAEEANQELDRLRAENAELRSMIRSLRQANEELKEVLERCGKNR